MGNRHMNEINWHKIYQLDKQSAYWKTNNSLLKMTLENSDVRLKASEDQMISDLQHIQTKQVSKRGWSFSYFRSV